MRPKKVVFRHRLQLSDARVHLCERFFLSFILTFASVLFCSMVSVFSGLIPWEVQVAYGLDKIDREYTYDAAGTPPQVEQMVTDEAGSHYKLVATSEPIPADGFIHEMVFTFTQIRAITAEQQAQGEAALRAQFEPRVLIDEDDYRGSIPFVSLNSEPFWRSVERVVDRQSTYKGLPNEDIIQLPEYADFLVTSDESVDASTTKSLRRAGVVWKTTGYAEDGRPNEFAATVTYRGVERDLVADYYLVTAHYEGVVPARAQMVTIVATYELQVEPEVVRAAAVPPRESASLPAVNIPLDAPAAPFPWFMLGLAAMVSLLGLLILLYFLLRNNAQLVETSVEGPSRVLLRKRLRLNDGEAVFVIPAEIELLVAGATHRIVLSARLAKREGMLAVHWGGLQLLLTGLSREVDLAEDLISAATTEVLSEKGLI